MTDRPRAGEEEENSIGDNNRPDEAASVEGAASRQEGAADSAGRSEPSPGRMLRRARESSKISLDEMVAQTKLSRSILEAMENDNFSALAEPVFARGYYRRCARVLEMPEDELLQAYEQASGEPPPRPVAPGGLGEDEPLHTSRNWLPMVLLVVLGCLLVAAIIWWTGQPKTSNTLPAGNVAPNESPQNAASGSESGTGSGQASMGMSSSTPPGSSGQSGSGQVSPGLSSSAPPSSSGLSGSGGQAPPAVNGTAASGNTDQAVTSLKAHQSAKGAPAGTMPQRSQQSAGQAPASRGQSPAQGQAATGQTAKAAKPSGVLHLSFDHKCWVSVHDATGKRLMSGMAKAGTSRDLKGQPPYRVVLGYAPGVRMTYNGKPVDLKTHTNGNAIAHVTVGHQ